MTITRFEPSSIKDFQTKVLNELSRGRVFCYFFASEIPETGKSWCSDCVKADPTIQRVFKSSSAAKITLLMIPVGQKDEWRNAQNIWRLDPLLNIKYVPTLIEMGENGEFLKRKLIEAEIWEQESSII